MVHIKGACIETTRLILRPYIMQDAEAVFKVVSQKQIYDMTLMIPHPYPRENVEWWIGFTRKSIRYGSSYEFGIFDKLSHEYIGNIGIANISKQNNNAELSYFIDPSKWQHGYATEAVRSVLKFGFDYLKLERIVGRCMSYNTASRCVMEKNGLLFEGIARHEVMKDGNYIDIIRLAILAEDYNQHRGSDESEIYLLED